MTSSSPGQRRWDQDRPVPWRRLLKEWAIVAAIGSVIIYFFMAERSLANMAYALAWSLPMYLGIGYVMAKLGIQRESLAERRAAARDERETSSNRSSSGSSRRNRPAPTKRTNASNTQRRSRSRR